jgi:chromosome segregation ATPase
VQGVVLSKALKMQQEKEDVGYEATISDLQGEVEKVQDSLEEKDNEIAFLKRALAEAKKEKKEAGNTHEQDMIKIMEQYETIGELHVNLKKVKEEINAKDEENVKLLESLRYLRDHCFEITSRCCDCFKKIFSSTGATSGDSSYANGDVGIALTWVEKELVANQRNSFS